MSMNITIWMCEECLRKLRPGRVYKGASRIFKRVRFIYCYNNACLEEADFEVGMSIPTKKVIDE